MKPAPYPICWIRLGEGAPSEPGVYLRAADVAGWLRSQGYDGLADDLDDETRWPATSAYMAEFSPAEVRTP